MLLKRNLKLLSNAVEESDDFVNIILNICNSLTLGQRYFLSNDFFRKLESSIEQRIRFYDEKIENDLRETFRVEDYQRQALSLCYEIKILKDLSTWFHTEEEQKVGSFNLSRFQEARCYYDTLKNINKIYKVLLLMIEFEISNNKNDFQVQRKAFNSTLHYFISVYKGSQSQKAIDIFSHFYFRNEEENQYKDDMISLEKLLFYQTEKTTVDSVMLAYQNDHTLLKEEFNVVLKKAMLFIEDNMMKHEYFLTDWFQLKDTWGIILEQNDVENFKNEFLAKREILRTDNENSTDLYILEVLFHIYTGCINMESNDLLSEIQNQILDEIKNEKASISCSTGYELMCHALEEMIKTKTKKLYSVIPIEIFKWNVSMANEFFYHARKIQNILKNYRLEELLYFSVSTKLTSMNYQILHSGKAVKEKEVVETVLVQEYLDHHKFNIVKAFFEEKIETEDLQAICDNM